MGINQGYRQTIGAKSVDASNIASGAATNGQLLAADGAGGASWINNAGSALTTKGDILGFDTVADRIPVGADGTVLTCDSSQGLGVAYNKAPIILADVTLGSAGPTLASGTIPARAHLRIHAILLGAINSKQANCILHGDSGNNYQTVMSVSGAAQATLSAQANVILHAATTFNNADMCEFAWEVSNIANFNKTGFMTSITRAPGASGIIRENRAGYATWANTAAQATSVSIQGDGTNFLGAGSRLWVEGW